MKKKQNFLWNEMTMGTCYYPEHWDKKLWRDDIRRMKKTGISVVRVGEFSWNKIEPEEGKFTFDFWDEFFNLCTEERMNVIFGTPTATPPAWLTYKYPEVLSARKDGVLYRHGARRHYNYNSVVYRKLVRELVTKIGEHYGKHPAIIGWQIDNEFNCDINEFYSEADSEAFRVFLQNKYKTLDKLNECWGTVFWNETYTEWEQIYVPQTVPLDGNNPHMHLDYYRFISNSVIEFCSLQTEIIRKYKKEEDFITTNGLFWNLDNHELQKECLDVYTYDSYPNFAFGLEKNSEESPVFKDMRWNKKMIETRSVCPHFGIMEQQSGINGWTTKMGGRTPKPGQLTLWAMQSISQGADFISFFRWRTCTFGTEMHWHGILDYDNRDNRKLQEVKDFYAKLKTLDPICGSEVKAYFGVIKDYDNAWDTNVDLWHQRLAEYSDEEIFYASEINHIPYDMVYINDETTLEELEKYPVLFYAHPIIMTRKRSEVLKKYVKNGGILIVGACAGYKEKNGKCIMLPQPGLLQELTGSDVIENVVIGNEEVSLANWNGMSLSMPLNNDVMEIVDGGKVLATYSSSYYSGKAALIEKAFGNGKTLHLGSAFCRENVKQLLEYVGIIEPLKEYIEAPEGVGVVIRQKEERTFLFVLNYHGKEQEICLKKDMWALYTGEKVTGLVYLEAFETAVYEII